MLGMGSLEILVILLISFLLLGPQKMISGARMLGDLMACTLEPLLKCGKEFRQIDHGLEEILLFDTIHPHPKGELLLPPS